MKNLIAASLVAIIVSMAILHFGAANKVSSGGVQETAYHRVLRTGVLRCGYATSGTSLHKDPNTGELTGYIADIVKALGEKLDTKIEWTAEVGYADFADGLKNGRYDMFCGPISITPARAKAVVFSTPYIYKPFYVYVRHGENRFAAYDSMNDGNYIYGTIDGEVFQTLSRKTFPRAHEISHVNMTQPSDLFLDLQNKKIDFLLEEVQPFKDYVTSNPGLVERFSDRPVVVAPAAFPFSPEELQLKNMIDATLLTLSSQGVIEKILAQHKLDRAEVVPVAVP